MPRTVTATIEGQTYEIPEMWLVGACRKLSLSQALQVWHSQAKMETEFRAQWNTAEELSATK